MKYPAYSRTTLHPHAPWIGELPSHWRLLRGRFIMQVNPAAPRVRELGPEDEVSFVPMEAVGERGGLALDQTRVLAEISAGYTSFQDGDVIVAKITPCFENGKGALACDLMNGMAFGTTELHVLRAGEVLDNRFLFYLTLSHQFRKLGEAEMYGAGGQKRVPPEFNKDFLIPLPPLAEQLLVANFLDWKTSQIDALIAKKRELVESLKEKRISVITQAVTKGLDPDTPMRDSGIDWLGQIPMHWEVKPVKFLTKILRGQFSHRPRNDPAFYDGEYPFIQTGDIAQAGKYVTTYSQTLNELGLSVSKQFPSGTLVMTIAANIGEMAIIDFNACFPDSIVGFVPESDIDLDFLYFMFVAMKQRLMMTAVLNTQLNLNIDRIASIDTIAPPIAEQKAIAELLDNTMYEIDRLITKAEDAISHLTEYRTALITSTTTGQIDVRDVAITTLVQP